ncbi:amino acid transporter AVT1D-like [Vicia villosa]|uniref:amino acid transporter AVT1D-like n=1 Tax=Vicia villosa TaxID=3911 RepID=UPI00273B00CD|nr:amino acid transporter AVT1D-like [Vicia villosa]
MPRGKMKFDEDLGPDREDDFQTDDEENQAERVFDNLDDDDTESDINNNSPPSRNLSNEVDFNTSWPQTYRTSMDMLTSVSKTPPGINFFKIISSAGKIIVPKECVQDEFTNSLTLPLVSDEKTSIGKEEPISKPQVQSHVSCPKISATEFSPPERESSFAQSVINGTNILCGIGLMTIPYAVKEGGWLSLAILLLFALACCYTGILLMRCLQSRPQLNTYPDIGQAAFGIAGRLGIAIILYMELFGSCVEYITLVSDNLSSLFPNTGMNLAGTELSTNQVFSITAALLVLPTVWLRDLSLLSYISVGGIFATTLVALCLFWAGAVNQIGFINPRTKILDIENISVSIGLFGFGFAGHAVFPNVYSSMKDQSKFPLVLYISFVFCLVMYVSVGVVGYLLFGDKVESQFTLNMPKELYASKIAIWTTVVTPLAKYALTLLPIVSSIEELVPFPRLRCYAMSIVIRTALVLASLAVALSFPYFGSVMALIGSMLSMIVALIYPCACYLKLHSGRLSNMQITNCILVIIVGVISGIIGTYSATTRIAGKGD